MRGEPLLEDRPHHFVALQIDAADLAGAVVDVEVAGEAVVLGRGLHGRRVGKVVLDIGRRAEQPFFFAAPERHAHGAVHFQVERFQNAHHFHGHGGAGAVIGGARAHVPGIEVAAHHHQLVGLGGAGNFGDHVERIGVGHVEFGLDVEGELHRDVVLQQARDAVVVLRGDGDRGRFLVGSPVRGAPLLVETTPLSPRAVGRDGQQDAFILPEVALLAP